ncbi:UNVERIFIED_CONTAM: hypothetical protein RMT77_004978 [Armadillidium vulgare]
MKFPLLALATIFVALIFVDGNPIAGPSPLLGILGLDVDINLEIKQLKRCGLTKYHCRNNSECEYHNLKTCKGYPRYYHFKYEHYCACEGSCD